MGSILKQKEHIPCFVHKIKMLKHRLFFCCHPSALDSGTEIWVPCFSKRVFSGHSELLDLLDIVADLHQGLAPHPVGQGQLRRGLHVAL